MIPRSVFALLFAVVLCAACRTQLGPPEVSNGMLAGRAVYLPVQDGEGARVYAPSRGRYLNDHTVVRGGDGQWHVIGITSTSQGQPWEEYSFLHATAPALRGPWSELPDALTADGAADGCCVWAPHVVEPAPGRWLMFYYAPAGGGPGLRRAESADLSSWSPTRAFTTAAGRPEGGRDPFALRVGDRWMLYTVGVSATSHGQILVTEVGDIDAPASEWSGATPVIEDPVASYGWGNLESPQVVPYEGLYYLFVTRTGTHDGAYTDTEVFVSESPRAWQWFPIARLYAHAAEVVAEDGQWFLTSGGWTSVVGEPRRGLTVSGFSWQPLGP